MDLRLRIVVVDNAGGTASVAYLGPDAIEADRVYEAAIADATNEAVRLFIYPAPARLRRPADEAAHNAAHSGHVEQQITRQSQNRIAVAEAAVARAQQSLDEALAVHTELTASESLETETKSEGNETETGAGETVADESADAAPKKSIKSKKSK